MSNDEIIVDNSDDLPSELEVQLTPKIREEMRPENHEISIQILKLAISGNFQSIETLVNEKIDEIVRE